MKNELIELKAEGYDLIHEAARVEAEYKEKLNALNVEYNGILSPIQQRLKEIQAKEAELTLPEQPLEVEQSSDSDVFVASYDFATTEAMGKANSAE